MNLVRRVTDIHSCVCRCRRHN